MVVAELLGITYTPITSMNVQRVLHIPVVVRYDLQRTQGVFRGIGGAVPAFGMSGSHTGKPCYATKYPETPQEVRASHRTQW